MIVFGPGRQRKHQAARVAGRTLQMPRRLPERRKIFHTCRVESSVAVVEPNLKAFVCKRLFYDKIGGAILVHIQCGNCQGRLIRFECQLTD